MCSQGEVVFQQGVENRVVSADLLLFCIFSSSASSLPERGEDFSVGKETDTESPGRSKYNQMKHIKDLSFNMAPSSSTHCTATARLLSRNKQKLCCPLRECKTPQNRQLTQDPLIEQLTEKLIVPNYFHRS